MDKFPILRPRSLTLIPITHGKQNRPTTPGDSWWQRWKAWWRYQQIQIRWDIERRVARFFGRRWGS